MEVSKYEDSLCSIPMITHVVRVFSNALQRAEGLSFEGVGAWGSGS